MNKKKTFKIIAGCGIGILLVSCCAWLYCGSESPIHERKIKNLMTTRTVVKNGKKVSSDIDKGNSFWNRPLLPQTMKNADDIITTEQLKKVFHGFYLYSMPQIYIRQFPNDFSQKGDADIFVKALMPLILRENQKIAQDRALVLELQRLYQQHKKWDTMQTKHFFELVKQYGLTREKMIDSQINALLERIDIIPPSLAVAMAGVYTDWGRQNLSAPFGQKEWVDKNYVDRQFDDLSQAVHSYMLELNTLPIYMSLRTNRQIYKNLQGSLGEQLLDCVSDFMRHDADYANKIKQAFYQKKLSVLDDAQLRY